MTPKRMNQILKIVLVLLAVVTAAGLYIANNRLVSTAQKTAELKAEVEINNEQLSVYERTKAQVEELEYVNELANSVLPANEDQSAIVAELSSFARRSGLVVSQINFVSAQDATGRPAQQPAAGAPPVAATVPKGVKVVPVLIEFGEGSQFQQILEFLNTIESNRRKSQVTNITLTPDQNNRSALNEVSITLNLYTRQSEGGAE